MLRKNPLHRQEQGFSLSATGAIGHVVGEKRFTESVQFVELLWIVMRGSDEWQTSALELAQAGFQESQEFRAVSDDSVLAGGFKT